MSIVINFNTLIQCLVRLITKQQVEHKKSIIFSVKYNCNLPNIN